MLFLILPVEFLNGTVSIVYPPLQRRCPPGYLCPLIPYRPPPGEMVPFWASLGVIGILLGTFALILGPRLRVGFAMGLAFSLGSMALLFWVVTLQILETFITTPASFLVFPETAVVAMAGATVLFGYELARRGREVIEAITS